MGLLSILPASFSTIETWLTRVFVRGHAYLMSEVMLILLLS